VNQVWYHNMSLFPSRLPICATQMFIVWFSLWVASPRIGQSGGLFWRQLSASTLTPTESIGVSSDQLLNFAEQLMREAEYFRAITEYRRFLFYYPDDPRRAMVHFSIGLAFYRGESYVEAMQTFREVTQHYPNTAYGKQAWLWQGESLLRQGQYTPAEQLYSEITERFPHERIGQQARYKRAWTLLYRRQWREAATQLQQVTPDSDLYQSAQLLAQEVLVGERLPTKSPILAGILSGLLPGSGQLYNGRLGDALLAFFLNSLFIVGVVEAIHSNNPAVAGILSFFEAGWYTGNVYGAINGANKYNRHITELFLRNLDNRFQLLSPETRLTPRIGVQFSLGF
jgi:TolA-binding protein/TM2 domain-containing membrane protein YozV